MCDNDGTTAKRTSAYADKVAQNSVVRQHDVTEHADCFASDRLKMGGGREAQHPTATTVFD